jgi:hypothetical protein
LGIVEARRIFAEEEDNSLLDWNRWRYVDQGTYRGANYVKVKFLYIVDGRYTTYTEYAENMAKLEAFCAEHQLILNGYLTDRFLSDASATMFCEFYLADQETNEEPGRNGFGTKIDLFQTTICETCSHENTIFAANCLDCGATNNCMNCGNNAILYLHTMSNNRRTDFPQFEFYEGREGHYCSNCSSVCTDCGNVWPNYNNQDHRFTVCNDCDPRFSCHNCGYIEQGERPENGLCSDCNENSCSDCELFFEDGNYVIEEDRKICAKCFNSLEKNIEVFDDDSEMPATRLALPTIQGRERIRFCGLEIEGVNINGEGHNILAQDFYDSGLSGYNSRRGYHERYDGGFVHVERDSSCDWEAVIGPVNMAGNADVRNLNRVIKMIRQRIKDETIKLSLSCGLHIHVSAEKVGIKQAHNLHLLYTYMEDIMYRMGAAKWPMHRAVVNGDHSYQLSPRSTKIIDFVNQYMDNRYRGLSFSNYFQKMLNSCSCGAGRFGLFEECTCSLHKCTFEFRIFNTTANTRKIHAYSALTQAIVAKAFSMDEFNFEEMPEMGFRMQNVKDMNVTEQEKLFENWAPRIKFILEELPLTDDEKLSIVYCIENSELSPMMGLCEDIINKNMEVIV